MKISLKTSKQYFTLIELLVVVAILSILMSLLSPALRKALYKAKTVACATNLKQLGVGILMYTDDFNDTYPHTCKQTATHGNDHWCRGDGRNPLHISSAHGTTVYYTSEELWPYHGGAEGYYNTNTCPHTPGMAPHKGSRNKMSTYNTFYWMGSKNISNLGQFGNIRSAPMRKLGERWRSDKRWSKNKYLWYNIIASDTYSIYGLYDPRNLAGEKIDVPGPHANHPTDFSVEWQKGQNSNGWAGTYGFSSVNSFLDDGSVILLMDVTNDTSLEHIGGTYAAALPSENGLLSWP